MTYENWCKNSTAILAEADTHNKWAEKAKKHLLTNVGPRIAALNESGYMGCGFHYSMEQDFGKLFIMLLISWQPCANWCANVEEDRQKAMIANVIYKHLLSNVRKAERSVPRFKRVLGK